MSPYPGSLAVGLLHTPVNATPVERAQARIALALKAVSKGYALVETYEMDAQALMYAGDVDLGRMHELADRVRLVLVSG